jgi:hypothetical protein
MPSTIEISRNGRYVAPVDEGNRHFVAAIPSGVAPAKT